MPAGPDAYDRGGRPREGFREPRRESAAGLDNRGDFWQHGSITHLSEVWGRGRVRQSGPIRFEREPVVGKARPARGNDVAFRSDRDRVGLGRPHRRPLHGQGEPQAARLRREGARRATDLDDRGRELPRIPRGDPRARADGPDQAAGPEVRRRLSDGEGGQGRPLETPLHRHHRRRPLQPRRQPRRVHRRRPDRRQRGDREDPRPARRDDLHGLRPGHLRHLRRGLVQG